MSRSPVRVKFSDSRIVTSDYPLTQEGSCVTKPNFDIFPFSNPQNEIMIYEEVELRLSMIIVDVIKPSERLTPVLVVA